MQSATLKQIRDAIVALVRMETGRPAVWTRQGADRPVLPYVALESDGGTVVARESYTVDNPNPTPGDPAAVPPRIGNEILHVVVEHTEFTLRVQAYTKADAAEDAVALANRVRRAFAKPSCRELLKAVSVAVFDRGVVQNLTAVIDSEFEGRAVFEVRLRAALGATDPGTVIETIEGAGEITGGVVAIPPAQFRADLTQE